MQARLDSILNELAYVYRPQVREQLLEVWGQSKHLSFTKGEFIRNNGMSSQLCMLTGTLPMTHRNVVYNIPIEIFITENFPLEQPLIYVRPTRDMIVTPNHSYVEPDGLINIATFMNYANIGNSWSQEFRLSSLLYYLSQKFGEQPPLFTRTKPVVSGGIVNRPQPTPQEIEQQRQIKLRQQQYQQQQQQQQQQLHHQQQGNNYAYQSNTGVNNIYQSPTYNAQGHPYGAQQQHPQGIGNAAIAVAATASNSATAVAATAAYANTNYEADIATATAQQPWQRGGYGAQQATQDLSGSGLPPPPSAAQAAIAVGANGVGAGVGTVGTGVPPKKQPRTPSGNAHSATRATKERLLTEKLTLRIIQDISKTDSDLKIAMKDSQLLQDSEANITATADKLTTMQTNLKNAIDTLKANHLRVDTAIQEKKVAGTIDPEDRLKASDGLSRQLVELAADDDACEDCLYQLDKASQIDGENKGKLLPLDAFLRETRKIAHKQFMKKAHKNKILTQLEGSGEYTNEVLDYWRAGSF